MAFYSSSNDSNIGSFIIGRQLTKDGTTLFGRTEDYPYYQMVASTAELCGGWCEEL